jgi:hypothetical protein
MERREESQGGPSSYPKCDLAVKIFTSLLRVGLFFFDLEMGKYAMRQVEVSMGALVGCFAVAEAMVWYRIKRKDAGNEWSGAATVGAHAYALLNVLFIGLTAPMANVPLLLGRLGRITTSSAFVLAR